ncbi:MAG TPA: class I SAM-dependent methyltransferase [Alphaproteobacteria bacterium]|nr:class I SAM-dependent methyltransferase [Alphaproteobacteria bacterium]
MFKITDADYGRTGDIFRCEACGFLQCATMTDVLDFYVEMADEDYEATSRQRALQQRKLLEAVGRVRPNGRLLDVGAGSGVLVEQAIALGYAAEGIEPSVALHSRARARGLPVHHGVLPNRSAQGPYDVVTVVDVIEHVPDPVGLMRTIAATMSPQGIAVFVTPDVGSLAARLFGWKWWHYRIAHIGYFDRHTLRRAAQAAGLEVILTKRPCWYFPASYLLSRAARYLPKALRVPSPGFLDRITVPLNLFDSLMVVCRKRVAVAN